MNALRLRGGTSAVSSSNTGCGKVTLVASKLRNDLQQGSNLLLQLAAMGPKIILGPLAVGQQFLDLTLFNSPLAERNLCRPVEVEAVNVKPAARSQTSESSIRHLSYVCGQIIQYGV